MSGANEWAGRQVLVVGLGVSGFAAARALIEVDAKVRVTEGASSETIESRASLLRDMGAHVETGGHDLSALDADVAIVSPGIPPSAPIVRAVNDRGISLLSEVELAYQLARCDFLAVTGTNGKTTTTSLLATMLDRAGIASVAAGNIGDPLVDAALSIPEGGAVAVEVSSFQLATIDCFRPRVAVVLNVAEDHTDWHGTFEDYAAAKARIFENQTEQDAAVVNADDAVAPSLMGEARSRRVPFSSWRVPREGAGIDGDRIVVFEEVVATTDDVSLPGAAGLEDSVAAAAAAFLYGVQPAAIQEALRSFRPLAHRLEHVATVDGVPYIDDSKATNPHATVSALQGMDDVVLIAGGRSKGIDLGPLSDMAPALRAVIALGEARDELVRILGNRVEVVPVDTMRDAVRLARAKADGRGSVLLSPACASLDMYSGYAARGTDFANEVRELADQGGA
ncbi:MAG: UDP-N-acetylmuramoyl-L-alanine--D-glutamate ligase [Actinomycetota bacterium]|nr:UDP-N-acetylmuramoyl-L-alanine--D-glutamate ligase [Actinomycetota bacterium]